MEIEDKQKKDEPIFGDTSFSAIMKDIYDNSTRKRKQIDILINELRPLIKQLSDAAMVVPLIKEYLEVAVKNDEQLVKLAAVYQKVLAAETRGIFGKPTSGGGNGILTDEEKKQLLQDIQQESNAIVNDDADTEEQLDELMNKVDALKTVEEVHPPLPEVEPVITPTRENVE